jgi:3-deoxy-D-manno-octulosonate 8-phosphate phosphatase KdsC-like HAD superfamily phosphatase
MDSAATEVDIAIDYAEEGQLGPHAATRLETVLRAKGITAVRSSVHVNCWVGRFDKRSMVQKFITGEWRTALRVKDPRYVYVGDSYNDEPMFRAFSLSVGVANVLDVVGQLGHLPKFVTRAREGKGFREVADAIVRSQL